MKLNTKNFTPIELNYREQLTEVSNDDFKKVEKLFDDIPYPEFCTPAEDVEKILELLPNLRREGIEDARVKIKEGRCTCGREMNAFDIVAKALSMGKHSQSLLEQVFNGVGGRIVVSTSKASDSNRYTFPKGTMFVEDSAPIPCANCGKDHELILLTDTILHYWVF